MAFIITAPEPVTAGISSGPAYFVIRDDSKPAMESTVVSIRFVSLDDAKAAHYALSKATDLGLLSG